MASARRGRTLRRRDPAWWRRRPPSAGACAGSLDAQLALSVKIWLPTFGRRPALLGLFSAFCRSASCWSRKSVLAAIPARHPLGGRPAPALVAPAGIARPGLPSATMTMSFAGSRSSRSGRVVASPHHQSAFDVAANPLPGGASSGQGRAPGPGHLVSPHRAGRPRPRDWRRAVSRIEVQRLCSLEVVDHVAWHRHDKRGCRRISRAQHR